MDIKERLRELAKKADTLEANILSLKVTRLEGLEGKVDELNSEMSLLTAAIETLLSELGEEEPEEGILA